jgi:hypothetical protein
MATDSVQITSQRAGHYNSQRTGHYNSQSTGHYNSQSTSHYYNRPIHITDSTWIKTQRTNNNEKQRKQSPTITNTRQ